MMKFVLGAACLVALSAGLRTRDPTDEVLRKHVITPQCHEWDQVLQKVYQHSEKPTAAAMGCGWLAMCIDPANKTHQDTAVAAGWLEALVEAMRNHSESLEVQKMCGNAIAETITFQPEYSRRAGRLGGLNLTVKAYGRWMNQSEMAQHGGDLASYLRAPSDDENRGLFRELGGAKLLVDNLKLYFHGPISDWDARSLKGSLFGLEQATWNNQDIVYKEGYLPLSLQLLNERTAEWKVAEETLQAVKAMIYGSPAYKTEYVERGLPTTLAKVLKENPKDGGAVSMACKVSTYIVGPAAIAGPGDAPIVELEFDAKAQEAATKAGLLTQLQETIRSVTSGAEVVFEDPVFDGTYNVPADCMNAMTAMIHDNTMNAQAVVKAGFADYVTSLVRAGNLDAQSSTAACGVLESLVETSQNQTVGAAVDDLCKRIGGTA